MAHVRRGAERMFFSSGGSFPALQLAILALLVFWCEPFSQLATVLRTIQWYNKEKIRKKGRKEG